MRGLSEAVSVLLLTASFLTISTILLLYLADRLETQEQLINKVLEDKKKQLDEKLSIVYYNKDSSNNWTIILYNYGEFPINIKHVYDSNGNDISFNITSNPIMPDSDATLTFNSNSNEVLILTDYNVYRVKI